MSDAPSFAAALGRIPSGLFILTAGVGDEASGMLASWIQQCSFEPPLVSVAVKRDRHFTMLLSTEAPFVVNIVAAGHTKFLGHFGKGFGPAESAFDGIEVQQTVGGIPILVGASAHLECRVVQRFTAGDHDLVISRVVGGRLHTDESPFVHVRKSGLHY